MQIHLEQGVIAALKRFYKNSKHNEIFNLSISIGSISNSEHRVASKCRELKVVAY
ncbi:transposase [Wolbachia endosymbiont of Armadillidium vulgare str. wVulC]|nr:transposase [Wolbachia endosymbiont of Armadillidium vulgare str. wVulC]RDD35340.1 transposase, degenerate [Wolbachia endosymbiont of Cylisticus convexus]